MGPSMDPKSNDYKKEDILQAVLIADGFESSPSSSSSSSFGPLTLDAPHTLLPLVSPKTALLDYSLQLLVASGVKDIFIVSGAFSAQVKARVESAFESWISGTGSQIHHVIADGASSVGDALREVDKSGLVTNDFVLITGDVVSNADLSGIIRQHKARKALDKQMAMTVVFRRGSSGGGGHRSCSPNDEVLVACAAETRKILHFQRCRGQKNINVPVDVFTDCDGDVELRQDLIDPGIAICSPIVPQIFSDDFDYLTRDDFIKGLLVHQEIMGNSLYLATLDSAYASRASDLSSYDAISQDVLGRWTFPLTPDLFPPSLNTPSSNFQYGHGSVYRCSDVVLGQEARLEANAIVGGGCKVGEKTLIRNSVVGENCVVGKNVVLNGVFVFDSVKIGANCRVSRSILASGVSLGASTTLEPGCVLGPKVRVGSGVTLPSGTELTTAEEFGASGVQKDLVGEDGFGFRFLHEEESENEDDEEEEEDARITKLIQDFWWKTKLTNEGLSSDDDDDSSIDEEVEDDVDDDAVEDEGEDEEAKDLKQFHSEVVDTLLRGVEENISSDNLVLEINSLKQAYFIYISEVQQCVVKCVLEAPIVKLSLSGKPLLLHVRKHGFPVLKNYVKDAEAQRLALMALADLCSGSGCGGEDVKRKVTEILTTFLGLLYNEDIIADSEVVFDWFSDQKAEVKKLFVPFVKNLQEAEEEDDDDDDD